jgi:hypothetical protein
MRGNNKIGYSLAVRTIRRYLFVGLILSVLSYIPVYAEDAAIILNMETICEISGTNSAEFNIHEKIMILNPKGKLYGLQIIHESKLIQFKDFSAKMYDAGGNLIKEVEKGDGMTICGYGTYEVYNDFCQTGYYLQADNYPYTIEYDYTLKQKTLFLWPDWQPQRDIPVNHAKYTLIAPEEFKFDYKSSPDLPLPAIVTSAGKIIYTWDLDSIPAFKGGEYESFTELGRTRVQFAPAIYKLGNYNFESGSWQNLSADYYRMIDKNFKLSKKQIELMDKIVAGSASQREICQKLHHEISQFVRYVAIHIGIGGWMPHESSLTFDRGYGDCKDLAAMYVSMLTQAGIEAKYVLLKTRDEGLTDPDFPSLAGFNHAILFALADGDTLWIDPTRQDCIISDLPWYDENTYALVIDPQSGCLITTDSSAAADNLILRMVEIHPQKNRSLIVRLQYRLRGNPRDLFVSWQGEGEEHDIEQFLKSSLYRLSEKFIIDSIVFPQIANNDSELAINLYGRVRSALYSVGKQQYIDLTFLNYQGSGGGIDLDSHTQPLEFLFPKTVIDSLVIHLPESTKPDELPAGLDVEDEIGFYKITSRAREDLVYIIRTRGNYQYMIMPADFPVYWEFLSKLKDLDEFYLKLNKN